jgi:hypothetical protein
LGIEIGCGKKFQFFEIFQHEREFDSPANDKFFLVQRVEIRVKYFLSYTVYTVFPNLWPIQRWRANPTARFFSDISRFPQWRFEWPETRPLRDRTPLPSPQFRNMIEFSVNRSLCPDSLRNRHFFHTSRQTRCSQSFMPIYLSTKCISSIVQLLSPFHFQQ